MAPALPLDDDPADMRELEDDPPFPPPPMKLVDPAPDMLFTRDLSEFGQWQLCRSVASWKTHGEEEDDVEAYTVEVPPGDSFSIFNVGDSVFTLTSKVGGGLMAEAAVVVVVVVVEALEEEGSAVVEKILPSFST